MKTIGSILFLLVLVVLAAPAQQDVVHFKKLQEFLPTISLPAWERGKPRGSTQSALGISTSEASIVYTGTRKTEQEEAVNTEISVTISDISLIPYAAMAFAF
jgi:hypothetical protein